MLRLVISFTIGLALMWGILGTRQVLAMGDAKFGTYSQAYLDRQKCKADARSKGMTERHARRKCPR